MYMYIILKYKEKVELIFGHIIFLNNWTIDLTKPINAELLIK